MSECSAGKMWRCAVVGYKGKSGAVQSGLDDRSLIRVMEDWTPLFPGVFLYYPYRKQQPAALVAVIETFRLSA
jgi:hypothetical protein